MSTGKVKQFTKIEGFGQAMYESLVSWMNKHWIEFLALKQEFNFNIETAHNKNNGKSLNNATFCITGSLERFKNRDALISDIEEHGGKYVSSVTSKTNYLINNDVNSSSSKNTKAKQVGCKVISEQDYLAMIN
jgi:DNA ligase (NAD+)